MDNLKALIASAGELLRMSESSGEEKAPEMRARIQERMLQAKSDLLHMQETGPTRVKAASRATDAYVHENPRQSAGIAASAGVRAWTRTPPLAACWLRCACCWQR